MKIELIFERHVTPAEAKKGHITIRKEWWPEFEKRFEPILRESLAQKGDSDYLKIFYLEGAHRPIQLKLCRRNPPRTEMRLYFNEEAGFKARMDEIVFVRFAGKRAYIGKRPSFIKDPRIIFPLKDKGRKKIERLTDKDDEGIDLNAALHSEPQQMTVPQREIWGRSASLARECIRHANYKCEAGRDRDTFTSKRTRKNYVEVHHLIPLSRQCDFKFSLDCVENLCCLSPLAHRAIHYGNNAEATRIIYKLLQKKRAALLKFGVNEDYLLRTYGIE
jgi:hypothetical protein